MNSRKTPAQAKLPPKPNVASNGGAPGPMSQQHTDDSGRNGIHPQKLPQLVGFRDPDAGKHAEGTSVDASVAAPVAAVPAAAA
jgi:hypothetical protein